MVRRRLTAALLAASMLVSASVQGQQGPVRDRGTPRSAAPAKGVDSGAPSAENYTPQGVDERGLWMQMDEAERELKTSNFVIRDPALNAYVKGVLCRAVGTDRCGAARIYIIRTPYFNANMAPNGMMQVWSGALLRVHDEAQLAAILAHEFGHFERRHTLQLFRDVRSKTDAMAWLSFLPYGVGLLAQVGMIGGVFQNSRDMETQADIDSVGYLAHARYRPLAASAIWSQLRDEMDATALERRRKSKKDKNGGFFATHPNSAERMTYLAAQAAAVKDAADWTGQAEYRAALAPWYAAFIDDQIKLNDFGATEFLIKELAAGGWTGELHYAQGELYRARGGDADWPLAVACYRQALAMPDPLPEVQRGLGLALLRTGATAEGQAALRNYVKLKPDAADRPMMVMLAGGES